jgi:hypothetical protein
MIGPATIGMVVFAPLTIEEQGVLSAHLTSGWYKQRVVLGTHACVQPGSLWGETEEHLADLHRHFDVTFDREPGGAS